MALDYLRCYLRVVARRDALLVLAHVRALGPRVAVDAVTGGVHVVAQSGGNGSEDSSHGGSFLGSEESGGGETRGTVALPLPPIRRVVHPSPRRL